MCEIRALPKGPYSDLGFKTPAQFRLLELSLAFLSTIISVRKGGVPLASLRRNLALS